MRTLRNCWIVLTFAVALAACGDKAATSKDKPDTTVADTNADALPAEVSGTTQDAGTDSQDVGVDGGGQCGAVPSCRDEHGKDDLSLCPKPVSDYACTAGCCVKKLICDKDQDCAALLGTPVCPDKRFTCGCDQDIGACGPSMCKTDAECGTGLQCHQGGCRSGLVVTDLSARLLHTIWITSAGGQLDAVTGLGAQAIDGQGNVAATAPFEFSVDGSSAAFTVEGTTLKATTTPGKSTVTAKITGSSKPASNPATLWNLGPVPAGKNLRVTAVDDVTQAPLTGKVVVVGLADAATPEAPMTATLSDGQATFADVKFPCDIHVLAADHATISVLRYEAGQAAGDLLLPSPLHTRADLEFDQDGKLLPDKSKLLNVDLLRGKVAYPGEGEAGVGVTSLAFGPSLLNFNVQSILGPQVKRPFEKDAPSIVNQDPGKPQDVPGGVTFELLKPVVATYVLAGTPGKHTVWTLAGRVALNDVIPVVSSIVDNVAGGLDIGKVVSLLLPYFSTFRSQVVFDVPFQPTLSSPIPSVDLAPEFPLGHHVAVTLPALPTVGATTWADLAFVIGGAMMPSGEIIPLGLTAGADKGGDKDQTPDGNVDGDPLTPGQQPLSMNVGPLHSGTRVGVANHVLISAAVVIANKDQGKREGGSIQISEPGVIPSTFTPDPFLPMPVGSTYEGATLTVHAVQGVHFYRATVQGTEDRQWLVVLPTSLAGKGVTLPDLTAFGADVDLATQPKHVYVAGFELRKSATLGEILGGSVLTDLVRKVKRTAFYDAL